MSSRAWTPNQLAKSHGQEWISVSPERRGFTKSLDATTQSAGVVQHSYSYQVSPDSCLFRFPSRVHFVTRCCSAPQTRVPGFSCDSSPRPCSGHEQRKLWDPWDMVCVSAFSLTCSWLSFLIWSCLCVTPCKCGACVPPQADSNDAPKSGHVHCPHRHRQIAR